MQERKIIQQSKSFKDLDRTLKKLISLKKAKLAGSVFEHLTKLFLEVSPEYKTKLKKVYLLNEIPTNIKRKLNLPNTDEGIDLVAETFDNQYWAIQCKYRSDKTETLKVKGDLATFNNLAFTVCKNISHGIIAATVNRPPQKKKLLKVGYILLTEWLNLDRNDGELFEQIKQKAVGNIVKPKKLSPRPHQQKAITKTISYFKSHERGKMIMPCGTGKSLTAFWIAEKMRPKSILVAVPSLALLQQTLKVWTREFLLNNIEPDWLCVCSDDTVKEEQDDFVTFSADLGIKVDTDPRVIRDFLKKKTKKLKIVFTTYQSGRATAIGSKGFTYDLGIMDEAHKTVGSGKKPMAHLLHQKNIKINKRLFMTATERLFRGDSDEYMSMDDPRDYGNLIYELSFKEAINSNPPIISDYKIITFGITTPEIEKIAEDNKYLEVKKDLKDITARELATAIALRKAIKKLNIKNAISFHRSIKRAENFRKQQDLISKIYPAYGKLKTFHVRGDMPTSDRALEMLSFEEEQGLMTNARCLTEGVDLPAIDCVCFTDPKRSKIDIVQAAGRALRLSKGKKFGYILIPIFIPDGVDFDTAAEAQGFDDVSVTVRALASSDKRIVEYLRAISDGKKPKGGSPVEGITSINQLYQVEAEKFNKAIQLKVWDKVAFGNWRSYEEAKKIIHKLEFKRYSDFKSWVLSDSRPPDIPSNVKKVYSGKGWKSWEDFLGLKKIKYLNIDQAREYVSKFNLQSENDWNKFIKNNDVPENIPNKPLNYYRFKDKSWNGWRDFLGIGFLEYEKAKEFVHKLKFKSQKEWKEYCRSGKKPKYIPATPRPYRDQKNYNPTMSDWLGNPNIISNKDRKYLPFIDARRFVRNLKLKNMIEWKRFLKSKKRPIDIPRNPKNVYKEFVSMSDWLGSETMRTKLNWRPFKKAKKFIHQLKLQKADDFKSYYDLGKIPKDIPKKPDGVYFKEWKGWPDFLNLQPLYTYEEAKTVVKKYKFLSRPHFRKQFNFKKNSRMPKKPEGVYYKKWKGWDDFLNKSPHYSYEEAKAVIKKYKFSSFADLRNRFNFKKDPRMPLKPSSFFGRKKTWKGWPDFLGKKTN